MRGSNNKVALVTGAGSGIGRAVSVALSQAGFLAVLCGRQLGKLEETAKLTGQDEGHVLCLVCDISKPEQVESMFDKVMQKHDRLDLLFNNAGVSAPAVPMEELSVDDWKSVVDINLNGAFFCAQQAIKVMKSQTPQGGRIINNGSISAHVPRPYSAPYTATKHAITGLTKSISLDGRKNNIACGQIDIGNAETPMTGRMQKGVPQANGEIAIEPVMDVEHVAQAVVQMACLPLESNVQFMTIMATKMPYIGRG